MQKYEVPCIRACPKCYWQINHKDKCKHMLCQNKKCGANFCFVCLDVRDTDGVAGWKCKSYADYCGKIAPRQVLTKKEKQ